MGKALMALAVMAYAILVGALCVIFPVCNAHAQPVPAAASRYRLELVRAAHAQWGLDAPIAALAAQVHQESGWNPHAVSQVGAQGLAQFMPATSTWWCKQQQTTAANCQPGNPTWALRALVSYDLWLHKSMQADDACHRLAFTLSAYNGGQGWVARDKAAAKAQGLDARRWFGNVDQVNAGRSLANWRENRGYPHRILLKLMPAYVAAGWGQAVCPPQAGAVWALPAAPRAGA